MAAKYDAESLLVDIEALLKADLNAKIAEISAEKADGLELKSVPAAAYFFQTLNEKCANFNPFVIYGITDGTEEGVGSSVAETVVMEVAIVVVDNGQDHAIGKRLLRYRRALSEVFSDKWAEMRYSVKLKVKSLSPVSLRLIDSSESYQAVGVRIEADLAS